VDDFFVGGAEGGQGAAEAGLAGDHKIIRAQAQVAVGTRDDGRRGRGPDAGWGHPAYTGTVQARSISLSSEMRVADLKT
jgi:hypothetical protein